MTAIDERRRRRSQVAVQWRAGTTGRRPRVVGVLVGVAAVAVLAGCSGGEPGAAAVVDGTAIPTADVRTAKDELGPYLQAVTSLNVLNVLVQAPTVVALADKEGVGVSDQDAQALLASIATQNGAKGTPTFSEPSLTVAKYSIAYNNLQGLPNAKDVASKLSEEIAALDVTVNPRFGDVGDDNAIAAPTTQPWIVTPKAAGGSDDGSLPEPTSTPTPTPTAS
jgi:hypothetical protein